MPDLDLVRACTIVLLLAGCGAEPMVHPVDIDPCRAAEPLSISGQVLDGEGRPLWQIEVTATDQRTNTAPLELDTRDTTGPDGHYSIELDHDGPTWLHFGALYGRTLAWIEVEGGTAHNVDVVLAEEDVVHCRALGEPRSISSYSMWARGPNFGFGMGGGCLSSHGTCGPEALTFIWPGAHETVAVRIGEVEIELAAWDEPCEVW